MSERYSEYPPIGYGVSAVLNVIDEIRAEGRGGVDFEFNPETNEITVIGVASVKNCAAAHWDLHNGPLMGQALLDTKAPLAAFSGIAADKPVIEKALGVQTALSDWQDTMVAWWTVNPDLASISKSKYHEDGDAGTMMGFMSLWAATSLLHDVPNWKRCVGEDRCLRERRPCPKHNELAYCAIDAWAGLVDQIALEESGKLNVEYMNWRSKLAYYCLKVQEKGILVDLDFVDGLEAAMASKKATLFPFELQWYGKPSKSGKPGKLLKTPRKIWTGPFNPNSPKAVLAWFAENGIELKERGGGPSMGKQVVLKKLESLLKPYGLALDASTGEVAGEDSEIALPEPIDMLLRLAQKTCAGKGLRSWFDKKYIQNGRIYPRFNPVGTSTGRLASSKPNFQNCPRVGFGAQVRKAVIAEPGCQVVKADYSQLEARICLWMAGEDPDVMDGAFEKLTERGGTQFLEAAKLRSLKPRDIAKSIVHAGNYLEGLKLMTKQELSDSRIIADRRAGALLVYDGVDNPLWTYRGRIVCFTGANLAERLFNNRTRESRAKALAIQKIYFDEYNAIRTWQMAVTAEAERTGTASLVNGHSVGLYNRQLEDNLKFLLAVNGQGGGAIYANEAVIAFGQRGDIPNLLVHDEVVFCDIPADWSPDKCLEFMQIMVAPSQILKGFRCPAKVSAGPNWKDATEIGVIRAPKPQEVLA